MCDGGNCRCEVSLQNYLPSNVELGLRNAKFGVPPTTVLNFGKSGILSTNDNRMAYINLHPKFGGNRSTNGCDTHVYVFPRLQPSAIFDLSFPHFGPPTLWATFSLPLAL